MVSDGSWCFAHTSCLGWWRWHDAVRAAVVQNHELNHGRDATALVLRRCNEGSLDVGGHADTDDFGFCDGQSELQYAKR